MSKASLIIGIIILALIAGALAFYFLIIKEKPPPGDEYPESYIGSLIGTIDLSQADPILTTDKGRVYILRQAGVPGLSIAAFEYRGIKTGDKVKVWVNCKSKYCAVKEAELTQ